MASAARRRERRPGSSPATARTQYPPETAATRLGWVGAILRDYDHLRAHVDHRLRVFLSEKDGVPIGLCLALVDGEDLHLRLAGFDYAAVGSDFAYFNVVYYEPIEWGIRNGIRSYHFGTGTYRAKTARGCRLEPTYAVVRWPGDARSDHTAQARDRAAELAVELGLDPTAPSPEERR